MKRLWKTVPPCLADTLGFQAVMSNTEGLGLIDDCSKYKPLDKMPKRAGEKPGWEQDDHRGGRGFGGGYASKHSFASGGRHHGDGGCGGRGGKFSDVRVVESDIKEEDVIHGTEEKMLQAFAGNVDLYNPSFVIVSTAPVSSMIGTDLDAIAQQITEKYGIPAASVYLDGQRDYLYGISLTLEAIGKLVIKKPAAVLPDSVNILGYNSIDWSGDAVEDLENWLSETGYSIVSRWGVREKTVNLERAASASVNLVLNIAGLRLAKWMESQFNIPYVTAAPFGEKQCSRILDSLKNKQALEMPKSSGEPEALVICEQLQAEAIRSWLLQSGYKSVRVCSLFEMDKCLMQEGDRKIIGEDDLAEQVNFPGLKLVLADPDYQFLSKRDVPWISLPNNANQAPSQRIENVSLVGSKLDAWLQNTFRKAGIS